MAGFEENEPVPSEISGFDRPEDTDMSGFKYLSDGTDVFRVGISKDNNFEISYLSVTNNISRYNALLTA